MDNDESKYFASVDPNFANAVHLCAAGLKFKDPEQGLDQTLAELLLYRAEKGETLTPNEMKKLAGLLSGYSIPYKCGAKMPLDTPESQRTIVQKVKKLQEDGKGYKEAILEVSKEIGVNGGVKAIEGYITKLNKRDEKL
tara:strand:+ start:102 stop:518 length:417 start_codon:yes stop_codon:yes gene_type:complete